jgi:hypothetical protein
LPTQITTPASKTDLITALDVVATLDIADADAATKLFLRERIKECSSAARRHCNAYVFGVTVFRLTLYSDDPRDKAIPLRMPASAISSITEAGTDLASADYALDTDAGVVYRLDSNGDRTCWSCGKIVINYKAGFKLPGETDADAPALPDEIASKILTWVKSLYLARGRDPLLKAEDVPGLGSAEYWVQSGEMGAIPPEVLDTLDGYRMPVIV